MSASRKNSEKSDSLAAEHKGPAVRKGKRKTEVDGGTASPVKRQQRLEVMPLAVALKKVRDSDSGTGYTAGAHNIVITTVPQDWFAEICSDPLKKKCTQNLVRQCFFVLCFFNSSLIVIQMDVRLPNGDVQCWGRCQSDNFKVVFFFKRFQFVDAADENKEKVAFSFSL